MAIPPSTHVPVLVAEVENVLAPQPGQVVVDGTLGGGGHARLLAERVGSRGLVIALDRDPAAIEAAERRMAGLPMILVHSDYCELPEVLKQIHVDAVDSILLDLGLSSDQLADPLRGFSFESDGPLDLRFDPQQGEPAWRLVNQSSEKTLADLIHSLGEERFARRIAAAIVHSRREAPLRTARELASVIRGAVPRTRDGERIHPATRTFQALRIATNRELKSLEQGLSRIPDCLRPGGKLAVISFHSLEDRRVKEAFRTDLRWDVLTQRPIRPTPEEVRSNPRSRSARLRAARRR